MEVNNNDEINKLFNEYCKPEEPMLSKSGKGSAVEFTALGTAPQGRTNQTNREHYGTDKLDDSDDDGITVGSQEGFGFAPEKYSRHVSAKAAFAAAAVTFLIGAALGGGGVYFYLNFMI
jgi:hypothetical protein